MTRTKVFLIFLSACILSACVTPQNGGVNKRVVGSENWPAMRVFLPTTSPMSVQRSNNDIFNEFLDLTFNLESGHKIPRLTRFEGQISVAFAKAPKTVVSRELDNLIARLRIEAGMNIHRIGNANSANIIIETLPKRQLQRAAPNAACIVVPRVSSWVEFRKNRYNRVTDWSSLDRRDRAIIFMPSDVSAQDSRDCLHEELAQALGPLNDLYRLPDSVYNDDNFHIVLTSYDMLILRAYYAPELRNGMSQHEVAAVLPRLLTRINPVGNGIPPRLLKATRQDWEKEIETALGVQVSDQARIAAADRALKIAHQANYNDHRLGFTYFARARVSIRQNPELAAADFARAYAIFNQEFGPYDIHTAQAALQMASLSISADQIDTALNFIDDSLIAAKKAQNGRLLFSLLAMKAEIMEIRGHPEKAAQLRKDAVSWGRYGIVPEQEIADRLRTISKLRPRKTAQKEG
ncbi:MAG: DUF2927 domain-containing protein [Rhodobacteraceae bacterium]|nr:DUF2927 domain-containing protein [Paracoccaceae bacterium]